MPIDGVIVEGTSTLNTSALTGESLPRDAKAGDEIVSGCINMTGVLKIRTTEGIRGVHGLQDSGSGGECQLQKIEIGGFHLEICPDLYPGCVLCGPGIGLSPRRWFGCFSSTCPRTGRAGFTGPLPSWLSAVPVRWLSASR